MSLELSFPALPTEPLHPLSAAAGAESRPAAPEPSWELLIDRHARQVRGAVRGALLAFGERPDSDRVDDLAQEVWCRLFERARDRRAGLRGASEVETVGYLRRVAATIVIDALRAAAAGKRRPEQLLRFDELAEPGVQVADPRACPERRMLARDRLRRFLAQCRLLLGPRRGREHLRIVRLAFVDGLSSHEIAARVGGEWTRTAIDSMLCRLRRRLVEAGEPLPRRARTRLARRPPEPPSR